MKSKIGDYSRMKKLFAAVFAVIVLAFFTAGMTLAADSDFKNSLLKVELNKISDNGYNITLYTQKIYNEPVKVIQKSDTVYYLLLPETSHAVTSVQPLDAITNVAVKSYPYAGQDLKNGYTKVAIVTSKPLKLSTSLKTLDSSISPRLDPLRLARLDEVFERYSNRLAENNIPTPLAEFRKTASSTNSAKTVSAGAQKSVSSGAQKTASKSVSGAMPAQKTTSAAKTSISSQKLASANISNVSKKAASSTSSVKSVSGSAQTAVQGAAKKSAAAASSSTQKTASTAQKAVSKAVSGAPAAQKTTSAVQKNAAKSVSGSAATQKTAAADSAKKSVSTAQKTVSKAVSGASAVQKPAASTAKTAAALSGRGQKVSGQKTAAIKTVKNAAKPVPNAVNTTANSALQSSSDSVPKNPTAATSPLQTAESQKAKQAAEFEKQLAMTEPVDVQFTTPDGKPVEAVQTPPAPPAPAPNKIAAPQNQNPPQNNNNLLILSGVFIALLYAYLQVKKANIKKNIAKAQLLEVQTAKSEGVKELLKQRTIVKKERQPVTTPDTIEQPEIAPADTKQVEIPADTSVENQIADISPVQTETAEQAAFQAYMETKELADYGFSTEDAEYLRQLYTPIESQYAGDVVANYDDTGANLGEVATIVSSSKLTETRGLYLAKYDGATSLVGYIQDDIYVLYNFGDMEMNDTDIQSRLAQENDTDSLYIVKTGGKKLMVKSGPYDLSLEMVM